MQICLVVVNSQLVFIIIINIVVIVLWEQLLSEIYNVSVYSFLNYPFPKYLIVNFHTSLNQLSPIANVLIAVLQSSSVTIAIWLATSKFLDYCKQYSDNSIVVETLTIFHHGIKLSCCVTWLQSRSQARPNQPQCMQITFNMTVKVIHWGWLGLACKISLQRITGYQFWNKTDRRNSICHDHYIVSASATCTYS